MEPVDDETEPGSDRAARRPPTIVILVFVGVVVLVALVVMLHRAGMRPTHGG